MRRRNGLGTILPGRSYSYEQTFSVGADNGEMQLGLQPHFGGDEAIFLGQA